MTPTYEGYDTSHRTGNPSLPYVTFDHFLYYGEKKPLLETLAPTLAKNIYRAHGPRLLKSLSDVEQREVDKILSIAGSEPPSPGPVPIKPLPSEPSACRGKCKVVVRCHADGTTTR